MGNKIQLSPKQRILNKRFEGIASHIKPEQLQIDTVKAMENILEEYGKRYLYLLDIFQSVLDDNQNE